MALYLDDCATPRAAVERLAARAWPADDLERRARKTRAVLRWSMSPENLEQLIWSDVAAIEQVFGRIETGELVAFQRADGTFELRKDGHHNMPKRGRRKAGRR